MQIFSSHTALCLHTEHPRNAFIFEGDHIISLVCSERALTSSGKENLGTKTSRHKLFCKIPHACKEEEQPQAAAPKNHQQPQLGCLSCREDLALLLVPVALGRGELGADEPFPTWSLVEGIGHLLF